MLILIMKLQIIKYYQEMNLSSFKNCKEDHFSQDFSIQYFGFSVFASKIETTALVLVNMLMYMDINMYSKHVYCIHCLPVYCIWTPYIKLRMMFLIKVSKIFWEAKSVKAFFRTPPRWDNQSLCKAFWKTCWHNLRWFTTNWIFLITLEYF